MTDPHLDTRFSDPVAEAATWTDVEALLRGAQLYWLTTVRADGRPHVTPVVGVWHDGAFCFTTGEDEQKAVNLRAGAQVAVTTGVNTWAAGTDVVLEGTAERVTGRDRTAPYATAYLDKYGEDWAWQPTDEGFRDPGADGDDGDGDGASGGASGAGPWVYAVRPTKVLAFAKDPHGQTTFRL